MTLVTQSSRPKSSAIVGCAPEVELNDPGPSLQFTHGLRLENLLPGVLPVGVVSRQLALDKLGGVSRCC